MLFPQHKNAGHDGDGNMKAPPFDSVKFSQKQGFTRVAPQIDSKRRMSPIEYALFINKQNEQRQNKQVQQPGEDDSSQSIQQPMTPNPLDEPWEALYKQRLYNKMLSRIDKNEGVKNMQLMNNPKIRQELLNSGLNTPPQESYHLPPLSSNKIRNSSQPNSLPLQKESLYQHPDQQPQMQGFTLQPALAGNSPQTVGLTGHFLGPSADEVLQANSVGKQSQPAAFSTHQDKFVAPSPFYLNPTSDDPLQHQRNQSATFNQLPYDQITQPINLNSQSPQNPFNNQLQLAGNFGTDQNSDKT